MREGSDRSVSSSRSMTKRWPTSVSCSITPWRAWIDRPVTKIVIGHCLLSIALRDPQGLQGLGDVMGADDLGAALCGDQMRGDRAGEPLRRLRRRHRGDEALARGADQDRQAELSNSRSRASAVMLCSGVLPKPMPGSSTILSRAMPALAAISSERRKNASCPRRCRWRDRRCRGCA